MAYQEYPANPTMMGFSRELRERRKWKKECKEGPQKANNVN